MARMFFKNIFKRDGGAVPLPEDFINPYTGEVIKYRDIDCAFCNGSGKHPDTGGWSNTDPKPCPACRGKGTVNVSSKARNCRYCGGKGKEPGTGGWTNTDSLPCSACGGKGVQELRESQR